MKTLSEHVHTLMPGDISDPEGLAADFATASLILSTNEVMVPIQTVGGQSTGNARWHEIKVDVRPCLGQH
jgi:hypothetical protein